MKKIAKRVLARLGIGIYRIKPSFEGHYAGPDWHPIVSPLEHNTFERRNAFFSNPVMLERYINQRRLDFFKEVVALVEGREIPCNQADVADVGCGTGHLLLELSGRFDIRSMCGYDYSEEALKRAESVLPGGEFHLHDVYESISASYDVVFCTEVLEHLLYPGKALVNLLSCTKPGGALLITVPDGRQDRYRGHINFWSPESWKVFVESIVHGCVTEFGLLQDGAKNFAIIQVCE